MANESVLKLAIFDLDGTLVELEHEHYTAQVSVSLTAMGMPCPSHPEIRRMIDCHDLSPLFENSRQEFEFWKNFDEGEPPPMRLFEPSLSTISNILDRGLDIAVATARLESRDEVRRKLRHTGLLNHIDFISTFYGTSWKDKIEQISLTCSHHGVHPSHSMMVGDGPGDMMSAAAVGCCLRLAIKNGCTPIDSILLHKPHAVLDCIGEVPQHVDEYREERLAV